MKTALEKLKPHRLLIVDDDQTLLLLSSMALDSPFCQSDRASGGEEALVLLEKNEYDLVILDLRMPDVSGLDVLTRMRARGDHTKVVVMSAFVPGSAVLRAASLGVTTLLGKPVPIWFLRSTVQKMLDGEVQSDFDLAREYASRLDFEAAHQVLTGKSDVGGIKEILWAELFGILAKRGAREDLVRLEGPSERLVTFKF